MGEYRLAFFQIGINQWSQYMSEWFYVKDGKQLGPVSEDALEGLISDGSLPSDSKVWKEGMTDWVPAAERNAVDAAPEEEAPTTEVARPLPGVANLQMVSIIACIVCLLNPFGAFAFVYALQAKNAHEEKRPEDAQRKMALCKKMLVAAFVLSAIVYAIVVAIFMGWIDFGQI